MSRFIDLSGQRFGRLTVIERAENAKNREALWRCVCDCGSTTFARGYKLRNGNTKSCGCWRIECPKELKTIHGGRRTRLYHTWCAIKDRCYNPKNKSNSQYGNKGVQMCEEWRNSFEAFRDWALTNGYSDELTIDRIDFNGNYEPSNCRWATMKEQGNNRSSNHNVTYNGKTHTLAEWQSITGINQSTLRRRLAHGWSIERALTEKAKEKGG